MDTAPIDENKRAAASCDTSGVLPPPFTPVHAGHGPSKRLQSLLFIPERCSGCGLCQSVCGGRADLLAMPEAARIHTAANPQKGGSFAVFCQHCLTPRCLAACPQGAINRSADGIVTINEALCVHCGMCQQACTEAAPLRSPEGRIRKCDLCGGDPACAKACPQQALVHTKGKRLRWIAWLRWPAQMLAFLLLVVVLVGSVCSLSIAAFDISCPTGVLQNIFSAKTLLLTSLTAALALIVLALVAGRAFCGWICPFGFVLDLIDKILPRKLRLPGFIANRTNKYGVLVGAVAASAATGNQAFCTVCPIGIVCRSYGVQSTLGGAELAMIPLIASMNLAEKRSWCRYFCPVGALFALFSRFGLVYLEIGAPRCKKFSCKRCAEVCPVGIIPKAALQAGEGVTVNMAECIFCLRCVDVCPHKAAKIRFGRRNKQIFAALPADSGTASDPASGPVPGFFSGSPRAAGNGGSVSPAQRHTAGERP